MLKLSRYWLIIEYHKDWIADLANLKAKKIIGFLVNMLEHMLMVILVFCFIEAIYAYFSQRNFMEVGKLIISTNLQMMEIKEGDTSR